MGRGSRSASEGAGLGADSAGDSDPTELPLAVRCLRPLQNALIDFCLECGDALRDWVQPAMRSQPVDPFGSAHIKVLFGLCGAIIFAEQGWNSTRDFDDGKPPLCAGNAVEGLRASLGGGQVVNDETSKALTRHLAGSR